MKFWIKMSLYRIMTMPHLYNILSSYPGSDTIYKADDKENTDDDVKGTCILLYKTLAVVTSAVRGNMIVCCC